MPGYLRFRRRIRLAPGVHLNVSKRGLSTSFGPRGFHYTVGHRQRRTTVGIPGTGLSYTTYSSVHARAASRGRSTRQSTTAATAPPFSAPEPSSLARLAALTPPEKIAWGLLYTLLVITAPLGLWLLITGLVQLRQPKWRLRTFVRQAAKEPASAEQLLRMAAAIDPHDPEVLGPLAAYREATGDAAAALPLYREYCAKVPSDWLARGHHALVALRCNQIDEAITELDTIRQGAPLTPDSRASVIAHLAYAHLCREDPDQALVLIDSDPGRTGKLGPGSQQCLFYRAVCHYLLGRPRNALADLEHLYAINPSYDGLEPVREAMKAGTYEMLLPDGQALTPAIRSSSSAVGPRVRRVTPATPHCANCQAPLQSDVSVCPYCQARAQPIVDHMSTLL